MKRVRQESDTENMQIFDQSVPLSHWQCAGQLSPHSRDTDGVILETSNGDE